MFSRGEPEEIWLLSASISAQVQRACAEIEVDNKAGKTRNLFKKIKYLTGGFSAKSGGSKSRNGLEVDEEEQVKVQWKDYAK